MKYIIMPIYKSILLILWGIKLFILGVLALIINILRALWELKFGWEEVWEPDEFYWIIEGDLRWKDSVEIRYYKSAKDLWDRKESKFLKLSKK